MNDHTDTDAKDLIKILNCERFVFGRACVSLAEDQTDDAKNKQKIKMALCTTSHWQVSP